MSFPSPSSWLTVYAERGALGGCAHPLFDDGYLEGGETFYPANENVFDIHEIGHLIGLCHVDPQYEPGGTMAAVGIDSSRARFSDEEMEAIRRVYSADLPDRASESVFRERGLIPDN